MPSANARKYKTVKNQTTIKTMVIIVKIYQNIVALKYSISYKSKSIPIYNN